MNKQMRIEGGGWSMGFYQLLSSILILAFWISAPLRLMAQSPATVVIEQRGTNAVLYVTGGTSNVQYQVWTSSDYNVASTNWYYWRRFYSRDFLPPGYGEQPVNGANTSYRPRSFYQIRGVLPD